MSNINEITSLYHSEEGYELAKQELLPLIKEYATHEQSRILEIGCSFGRNLVALASLPNADITGCDIDTKLLSQAQKRLQEKGITAVKLVHQTNERQLPFDGNSFDIIVTWQLLEHVMSPEEKKCILQEAARVVKNNGIIIIETPNQLFPIDYHDTNLPFIHWIFPDSWREYFIRKIRKNKWPASQYTTIFQLKRFLKTSPGIQKIHSETKIYFQKSYQNIFKHWGGTRIGAKKIFFILYYPFYLLLRLLGLPGDTFTPSLRVVFRVNK